MVINNVFVKVNEAARTLGFSVQHTRFLIRQGYLKGSKVGRDWIIERDVLEAFVVRRNTAPMFPSQKKGRPPKIIPGYKQNILVTKEKQKSNEKEHRQR